VGEWSRRGGEGKGGKERGRGREGRELPRAPRMLGPALGMHKRFSVSQ